MDPDMKALQEEVKRTAALSADTNRIVHELRRTQRWHTFVSVLWWGAIIGLSAASYWYALPYIQKAQDAYSGFQHQAQQAQTWQQQAQDLLNKYLNTPKP